MEAIIKGADVKEIIATFKEIIGRAYGQRDPVSPTKFFKSGRLTEEFLGSLAFDTLFSELMTSEVDAAEFVNGLIPKDLAATDVMKKALAEASSEKPRTIENVELRNVSFDVIPDSASGLREPRDNSENELLAWAFRDPTKAELQKMSETQLKDVFVRRSSGWKPPEMISVTPAENRGRHQVGTPSSYFEENEASGLELPRDDYDSLLPWALRNATEAELRIMTRQQLVDVNLRSAAGWTPRITSL
jgi:uncharacterized protein YjiS (DUF1127 family)